MRLLSDSDINFTHIDMQKRKGRFYVFDGINGCGKGLAVNYLGELAMKDGYKVFDIREFQKKECRFPEPEELDGYDVLLSAEPTHAWVGEAIRKEMFYINGRDYSDVELLNGYALDRLILHKRVLVPFLNSGGTVYQERSFSTTVVFETILEGEVTVNDVINHPCHRYVIDNIFDKLYIIGVDPSQVAKWLDKRGKEGEDDNDFLEALDRQKDFQKAYNSSWFKKIFVDLGVDIKYVDNITTEDRFIQHIHNLYTDEGLTPKPK